MRTTAAATLAPGRTAAELFSCLVPLVAAMGFASALPDWRDELATLQLAAWTAFAALGVALWRSRRWHARHDVLAVVAVAALLRAGVVARAPELSDDLWRFLWDGRVLAAGKNPYAFAPADSAVAALDPAAWIGRINHPALRTIYPPLAEAGFALVHALQPGVLGMKLWIVAHDLLLCGVLARWARERTGSAWGAMAYAWNPLFVIEYAGTGHFEPVALLPLALALRWAERRPRASALLFAAAALTKLLPLLALPLLWRRWGGVARALALGVTGAGLALFVVAARGPGSGLEAFARHWSNNELLFALAARALGDPLARALAALAGVAAAAGVAWRGHELARGTRAVLRTALLAGPVLHPWYLGWACAWDALAPSAPWLLLCALSLLNYGVLAPPAEGAGFHLPLGWRLLEYGAPALLALALHARRRTA